MKSDNDLLSLVKDIEDRLFSGLNLDVWERVGYWHLLRQTRLEGRDNVIIGLDSLARATAVSTTKLLDTLRSLAAKGCLIIDDRSRPDIWSGCYYSLRYHRFRRARMCPTQ